MPRFPTVTQTATWELPDLRPRVERGMALLDAKVPGWWEKINLKELDLGSYTSCVVGQLAIKAALNGPLDGYDTGVAKLFTKSQLVKKEDARHGINLTNTETDTVRTWVNKQQNYHPWQGLRPHEIESALYSMLTEIWLQIIKARQDAAKAKAAKK